jgi:hypothetical protein
LVFQSGFSQNVGIGTSTPATMLGNGTENSALGRQTLFYNSLAYQNVAVGYKALRSNSDGFYNTQMEVMPCIQIMQTEIRQWDMPPCAIVTETEIQGWDTIHF